MKAFLSRQLSSKFVNSNLRRILSSAYMYVWFYGNEAKGWIPQTKRALFSSPELQRGRYKNQKDSQSFFPSSIRLSSFHCRPVSIFRPLTWLGGGIRVKRNRGEIRVIGVELFSTVFINPDICTLADMSF